MAKNINYHKYQALQKLTLRQFLQGFLFAYHASPSCIMRTSQ